MFKYMIKEIRADLINCSTLEQIDHVKGDVTVVLWRWDNDIKYFEKSELIIPLSSLSRNLEGQYFAFEELLITYIQKNQVPSWR